MARPGHHLRADLRRSGVPELHLRSAADRGEAAGGRRDAVDHGGCCRGGARAGTDDSELRALAAGRSADAGARGSGTRGDAGCRRFDLCRTVRECIEEVSDSLAGLSLQGPNARIILETLGVQGIGKLPHFGIMETSVDGHWLRIDRAGFTGDLGYEIWVKPQDALWLWETLFRIGDPLKIAPMGGHALEMTRIEAGFILLS